MQKKHKTYGLKQTEDKANGCSNWLMISKCSNWLMISNNLSDES